MNENEKTATEPFETECPDCVEYQYACGFLAVLVLVAPIVGMLIGLFAGKKLATK